jgi:hypothetical protein
MVAGSPVCPVCGSQNLEEDSESDEWLCPQCDYTWPARIVRGEQQISCETIAVRDDDGSYSLYELWFVDDPDTAKIVQLRGGLSRAEAENEASNVFDEDPESHLLS